uniref:Uncharacterized protein n=1 Tax=Panagrolaimus sp. JU765 TaxID=591449 RepID=A0AC34QYY3_9BILA
MELSVTTGNCVQDVLKSHVIVRRTLEYLLTEPVDLSKILNINHVFESEVKSLLRKFKDVRFETVSKQRNNDGEETDSTQPSDDEEYEFSTRKVSFNNIQSRNAKEFAKNLKILMENAVITGLDFSNVTSRFNFGKLATLTGLQKLIFPPKNVEQMNWKIFDNLLATNQESLRVLRHPRKGFFNFFDKSMNLDLLEVDFRNIRPYCSSDDFVFEVYERHDLLLQNAQIDEMILHGFNRVNFWKCDRFLMANRRKIQFCATEDSDFSDDLFILREWNNRNWTFEATESFDMNAVNLARLDMAEVIRIICCIFVNLKVLKLSSIRRCNQQEALDLIVGVYRFCRDNFPNVEKSFIVPVSITKEDRDNFLKRIKVLDGTKNTNQINPADKHWKFQLRTNQGPVVDFQLILTL